MDKIIFWIKNQIYETLTLSIEFLKTLHIPTLIACFILIYVLFLRKWDFKKTLTFLFQTLIFFLILVRVENLLLTTFGAEGSYFSITVARIVFLVLVTLVFLYQGTVKE